MKVSGVSFIRNAVKYDYPIVEAITSVLPACDEFVIAVGNSEDGTEELIQNIHSPKIKIIKTVWDETLREGGRVLAEETNKAFSGISPDPHWAFYIQGDEVMHEKHIETVLSEMKKWKEDERVEGLLFNYRHFYGSYNYTADSHNWYRKEIRIIRNDKSIQSYRDAQGFRKNGKKLKVKQIEAYINHYGWVKHPKFQQAKQETFHKLWHNDDWLKTNVVNANEYDYSKINSLIPFLDSHPAVMKNRLERMNWDFKFDMGSRNLSAKDRFINAFEKLTGKRLWEYRNYEII
jgi:hypothetical protein